MSNVGEERDFLIQKNILDLRHSRYLQYQNTLIIILYTYLIALAIAILTGQTGYHDINQLLLVSIVTIVIVFAVLISIRNYRDKQKEILQKITELAE